jgi:hypothetical protein
MKLTPQQIKAVWIVAAVLLIIHLAPTLITTVRQEISTVHAGQAKPSPLHPMVATPAAVAPASLSTGSSAALEQAGFIGVWRGSELMPDTAMYGMQLELRWSDKKPGEFVGYLTRTCTGGLKANSNDLTNVVRNSAPVSGILSGPMVNDAIQLHLDTAIGVPPNGCSLTNYTVRKFSGQISAEWQAGTCPAGTMMLSKVQG